VDNGGPVLFEGASRVNDRTSSEVLTIRELVETAGLQLTLLAGARNAGFRIEAVYIGDLDDPTPWMVPASLLLTTGPTFESDPEAGADLVRLLKRTGAVGVAVAITPHVHEVPQAMIDEAEAVGLPLIRVPPETPFRAITSYVFNALTSRDMHRLRRSLALQNQLLQALVEGNGIEGLVSRLADFIAGDALLFDSHGEVLAQSMGGVGMRDHAQPARVWQVYREVTREGAPRSVLEVDAWRAHYREIVVEGAIERVLVALQPLTAVVSEYDEATLTFAQRLVEAELSTERNVSGMRRRTREGLLHMLVHGRGTTTELSERLLYHGIQTAQPWRIMVVDAQSSLRGVATTGSADALGDVLLDALERVLEEQGVPFLSMLSGGRAVVLSVIVDGEGETDMRARLEDLARRVATRLRGRRVRIGTSEPLSEPAAAPDGLAHARQSLEAALRSSRAHGDVVFYEDLGLRAEALDRLPDDVLRRFRARVVDRLEAVDRREGCDLVHTLERYLAHDCSVSATAEELYLHRNTLRKRLERIERTLSLDLSSVDDLVEVYLGVRAAELLDIRSNRDSGVAASA